MKYFSYFIVKSYSLAYYTFLFFVLQKLPIMCASLKGSFLQLFFFLDLWIFIYFILCKNVSQHHSPGLDWVQPPAAAAGFCGKLQGIHQRHRDVHVRDFRPLFLSIFTKKVFPKNVSMSQSEDAMTTLIKSVSRAYKSRLNVSGKKFTINAFLFFISSLVIKVWST